MGAHRKKIPKLCFVVDGKMIGFFVSLKQMVTVTASGSGLFAAGPAGLGFKFVAKLPSFSDVFLFLHVHSLITCFPVHSVPLRNISNSIWLHTAHCLTSSAITYRKRQVQPIRWSYFALRQEANCLIVSLSVCCLLTYDQTLISTPSVLTCLHPLQA